MSKHWAIRNWGLVSLIWALTTSPALMVLHSIKLRLVFFVLSIALMIVWAHLNTYWSIQRRCLSERKTNG